MQVVNSLEGLINGSMPAADILLERDAVAGRARISVNGRQVAEEACGSFNPTQSGGWHLDLAERYGTWASPETLADVLYRCLARLPEGCIVHRRPYMSDRI
ncbi:hypothetical protein G6L37_03780 [Agrobacterium rubi]|nr:hypothetical protein [Agrobacterium rubi]NTF24469.1 hypothetical protein [Agrobacterium rubi]